MSKPQFRMATIDDWREILDIYEPYIYKTPITFDYDTFTKEEFQEKINKISKKLPYLVCIVEDKIVGYAYCSPYLEKEGFSWDCEITIYINEEYHGQGIASEFYDKLIKLVTELGYYNVYSLICIPNIESVTLHKKFGFDEVGVYKNTAYKLGKWRDLLVMQKVLSEYAESPTKPKLIVELSTKYIDDILQ